MLNSNQYMGISLCFKLVVELGSDNQFDGIPEKVGIEEAVKYRVGAG